jgi:hypothetical protein
MDAIHFCWLIIRAAYRHSLDLAQTIIFLALAAVGIAIFVASFLGIDVNARGLVALLGDPRFYAVLFGCVILTRLICAPYWVWKAERDKPKNSNGGTDWRAVNAQHDLASATREHTEELRRQRQKDSRDH